MSRTLTVKEIDDILDFIKPQTSIPLDSAMAVVTKNKEKFKKQLINQKI